MKNKLIIMGSILIVSAVGIILYYNWSSKNNVQKEPICQNVSSYNIMFDTMGGNSIDNLKVDLNDSVNLPTPNKKDVEFAGWYYDKEYNNPVSGNDTSNIIYSEVKNNKECIVRISDVTLYAKWVNNLIEIKKVTLNKESVNIYVGEKITLEATIEPSNATNKSLSWTSSKNEIATVKDGVVTGLKAGKTTITVISNNNQKAEILVTVKEKEIPVETINLDKEVLELDINGIKTYTLKTTVTPANANQEKTWSVIEGNDVVSVNSSGVVTALKGGKAKVQVKAGTQSATVEVRVQDESLLLSVNREHSGTQYIVYDSNGIKINSSSSQLKVIYTYWHYYGGGWNKSSGTLPANDLKLFQSGGLDSINFSIMDNKLMIKNHDICENIYFEYNSLVDSKPIKSNIMKVCVELPLERDTIVGTKGISNADSCWETNEYCNDYEIVIRANPNEEISLTYNQDVSVSTTGNLKAIANGKKVIITNPVDKEYLTVKTKGQSRKYKIVVME